MAIYPVVNKETGEKKEVSMSIHDIDQWYSDNPDWQRDWQAGVASCPFGYSSTGSPQSYKHTEYKKGREETSSAGSKGS